MALELLYVELKSGHNDDGPAWIGFGRRSRSGASLYFNGLALRRLSGGFCCNYFDAVTSEVYWVSGVKKNAQDRHWAGHGDILIDHDAIPAYLEKTGRDTLPRHVHETTLKPPEPPPGFHEEQNARLYAG